MSASLSTTKGERADCAQMAAQDPFFFFSPSSGVVVVVVVAGLVDALMAVARG
jgi:hypothetical protein